MSRGDWDDELKAGGIIAAVAVLLATVAWIQGLNQKNDTHYKRYEQQISELRRLNNPRLYQPDCQSPESDEEADLCAQRDMAEAAWELFGLTALQLFLTALGTGAILVSLKFTRDALKQAELSAQSARKTVQHMEETSEKELRAYINLNTSHLVMGGETEIAFIMVVDIVFKNFGSTPAHNVHVAYDITFKESSHGNIVRPVGSVGPSATFSIKENVSFWRVNRDHEFMEMGQRCVSARAFVTYHTEFDKPDAPLRQTEICVVNGMPFYETVGGRRTLKGFHLVPYGHEKNRSN